MVGVGVKPVVLVVEMRRSYPGITSTHQTDMRICPGAPIVSIGVTRVVLLVVKQLFDAMPMRKH